jgi:hypothetical protein
MTTNTLMRNSRTQILKTRTHSFEITGFKFDYEDINSVFVNVSGWDEYRSGNSMFKRLFVLHNFYIVEHMSVLFHNFAYLIVFTRNNGNLYFKMTFSVFHQFVSWFDEMVPKYTEFNWKQDGF